MKAAGHVSQYRGQCWLFAVASVNIVRTPGGPWEGGRWGEEHSRLSQGRQVTGTPLLCGSGFPVFILSVDTPKRLRQAYLVQLWVYL